MTSVTLRCSFLWIHIPKSWSLYFQAWAALEYLDHVIGRLLDYLATSGLDETTYVMLLSDNGSALLPNEGSKSNRMVSLSNNCDNNRG
jgi:arylsulfatase A-like enzyme